MDSCKSKRRFSLFDITAAGTYSVVVTNNITNCSLETDLQQLFLPNQSVFATLLTPAFSIRLAAIEATAVGGFGEYEYSLNAIDWQSSPILQIYLMDLIQYM